MEISTTVFKEKLEQELETLTTELEKIARVNPQNKDDWEARRGEIKVDSADQNERADAMEEYESNVTILRDLEVRHNNVTSALKRIEDGTYGVCEVGGEPIENDRLEANPAATTCKNHIDE